MTTPLATIVLRAMNRAGVKPSSQVPDELATNVEIMLAMQFVLALPAEMLDVEAIRRLYEQAMDVLDHVEHVFGGGRLQ